MDTNENENDPCENPFCIKLGVCIGSASDKQLLEALQTFEAEAYRAGLDAVTLPADPTPASVPSDHLNSLEAEALLATMDSLVEAIRTDFEDVQGWADKVYEALRMHSDAIEELRDDADADAPLLEALASRLADLEQENRNLWEAVLASR